MNPHQTSHSQDSVAADAEELRALSYVRRSILKKIQKISELEQRVKELEQEVDTLLPFKWRCDDQEKQLKALQSELDGYNDPRNNVQNFRSNNSQDEEIVEFDHESRHSIPIIKDEFMESNHSTFNSFTEEPSDSVGGCTGHICQADATLAKDSHSSLSRLSASLQAVTESDVSENPHYSHSKRLKIQNDGKEFENIPISSGECIGNIQSDLHASSMTYNDLEAMCLSWLSPPTRRQLGQAEGWRGGVTRAVREVARGIISSAALLDHQPIGPRREVYDMIITTVIEHFPLLGNLVDGDRKKSFFHLKKRVLQRARHVRLVLKRSFTKKAAEQGTAMAIFIGDAKNITNMESQDNGLETF